MCVGAREVGRWIYPASGCEVVRKGVGVMIGSKQVRRAVRLQDTDVSEELVGSVDKNSQRGPKIAAVEGIRVMWKS